MDKIRNLYQDTDVLLLRECYALEKVHGTNAVLECIRTPDKDNGGCELVYKPGGCSMGSFMALFDQAKLLQAFIELGAVNVKIYGEAYGGSMQKQSHRYGKDLKFVAFEVVIDGHWLDVLNAHDVCTKFGLEFVHYVVGPATLEFVNAQRDAPSVQAVRNGITEPMDREGIVIRPMIELTKNDGRRVIAKHKGDKFSETKTPRNVDPELLQSLSDANAVAEEWVVTERLKHVLDKLEQGGKEVERKDTKVVIAAMLQDIKQESSGEIVWSRQVFTTIGRRTAKLFKMHLEVKFNDRMHSRGV
jgi:hypothetical protein